jgi:nucleoside-diphosphate-sugar epimerase
MTILITGGAGFVGLAAAEAALARDVRVVILDRQLPAGPGNLLPGAEAIAADVTDAAALETIMLDRHVSHVLHAAAITTAEGGTEHARLFEVNVLGTIAVCEAAKRAISVERLVLVSSGSVLEGYTEGTITDDALPTPVTAYGASKLGAELTARALLEGSQVELLVARLGPTFGPFERVTSGRKSTSPIHRLVSRAVAGQPTSLWEVGYGDWLYSRDAGAALVQLLLTDAALSGDVFLLSGEQRRALDDFAGHLASAFPAWEVNAAPFAAAADICSKFMRAPFSCARARTEIEFRPRPLTEALDDYLAWIRAQAAGALQSSLLGESS